MKLQRIWDDKIKIGQYRSYHLGVDQVFNQIVETVRDECTVETGIHFVRKRRMPTWNHIHIWNERNKLSFNFHRTRFHDMHAKLLTVGTKSVTQVIYRNMLKLQ